LGDMAGVESIHRDIASGRPTFHRACQTVRTEQISERLPAGGDNIRNGDVEQVLDGKGVAAGGADADRLDAGFFGHQGQAGQCVSFDRTRTCPTSSYPRQMLKCNCRQCSDVIVAGQLSPTLMPDRPLCSDFYGLLRAAKNSYTHLFP